MRMKSNYDLYPHIHVETDEKVYAIVGWEAIGKELRKAIDSRAQAKTVLCVDC